MQKTISDKKSKNDFPILENIKTRWSIRAFADKPVSDESMRSIFEAARWSASAINEQPWQYIYAHKGTEGFDRIWNCLMPGNQPWAKNASVLIAGIARKTFAANQKNNPLAMHDLGMADASILHQAISMGIYSHPMAGFDKGKLAEALQLSEDQDPLIIIALGYPGNADSLEEPFKTRELAERTRKPIDEFVKEI